MPGSRARHFGARLSREFRLRPFSLRRRSSTASRLAHVDQPMAPLTGASFISSPSRCLMPFDPSSDDDDAWWNNLGPLRLTIHPQAPSNPPSNAPLVPGKGYDDWATQNGPVGGTPYPDDWFVPADAHASTAFPDDWFVPTPPAATSTQPPPNPQPGVTTRPAAPLDPFAAFWASIPASRVGALAWHPPIFPNASGQFELPAPAPLTAPPEAANGILGGIAKMLAAATDAPSMLGAIGRLPSAAPESPFSPGRLFSRDPSVPVAGGPFPYPIGSAAGLASPFERGFFYTGGGAASRPMPGTPGAPATLGLSEPTWAPPTLAQSQSPLSAGGPSFGPLSSGSGSTPGTTAVPAPPTRSVLFIHPPVPWDLSARDRTDAEADQAARSLAVSGLPISKSGAPFVPPPLSKFSITPEQALDFAHFVSPNIVDYFTKPLPPPQPFPATPGKIPSTENPYAVPAALEAATWLLPADSIADAFAGTVERDAAEAASLAAKAAAPPVPPPTIPERLLAHVKDARVRVEMGGLTEAQRRAVARHPRLEAAYKGERIDTFAKETIVNDENLPHLIITPRFQFGPDVFDPINRVWYDIATPRGWARHERKYSHSFGRGIPLFYGDQ